MLSKRCLDAHEGTDEASPLGITAWDESLIAVSNEERLLLLRDQLVILHCFPVALFLHFLSIRHRSLNDCPTLLSPLFQSHPGGRIVHIMNGYFREGYWLQFGDTLLAFWHNIIIADLGQYEANS